MTIRFLPLGTLISTSLAYSASMADSARIIPVTASVAGHALNLQGPTGSVFMVMSASTAATSPFGLIISS